VSVKLKNSLNFPKSERTAPSSKETNSRIATGAFLNERLKALNFDCIATTFSYKFIIELGRNELIHQREFNL
jgi:hypothetical protein